MGSDELPQSIEAIVGFTDRLAGLVAAFPSPPFLNKLECSPELAHVILIVGTVIGAGGDDVAFGGFAGDMFWESGRKLFIVWEDGRGGVIVTSGSNCTSLEQMAR